MMQLILVRHGRTALNAEHRYQGQLDVELDENGLSQAGRLGERLQGQPVERLIASDLRRALQTAQAIATRQGLEVEPEARLREISFGEWEGLTRSEIQARWPDRMAAWFADMNRTAAPGGETLQQVMARVQSFWDDIRRAENGQTMVVVAHGGVLRVLLCLALGLPPQEYWRFNLHVASISQLEVHDGQAILVTLNDTHHCL